jgi:hypothetical protein
MSILRFTEPERFTYLSEGQRPEAINPKCIVHHIQHYTTSKIYGLPPDNFFSYDVLFVFLYTLLSSERVIH